MHRTQRERASALLKEQGITHALFADHTNIAWLTGFAAPVYMGTHPMASAPALLWYGNGEFTLFLPDTNAEFDLGFDKEDGCAVVSYPGNPYRTPALRQRALHSTLAGFLASHAPGAGAIGIEAFYVPTDAGWLLRDAVGTAEIRPIDELITPLRAIKTAEEIAILQRNFDLTGVGQAAAKAAVRPGVTEMDVWNAATDAIEKAAGERVGLGNDFASGRRVGNIGGPPTNRVLDAGDSMIVDISVIRAGYWSDCCATYFTAEPTERQLAFYRASESALALGKSMLKPGTMAKDVDAALRAVIVEAGFEAYSHHSGHGVGTAGHEAPFMLPDSETVLEPGMVLMLEPGCYVSGEIGVRLEDAFLITEDGCAQLTHHDKRLA
jgi:Xaa-Pro dipeptidase